MGGAGASGRRGPEFKGTPDVSNCEEAAALGFSAPSPLIALALTIIAGAVLFSLLGKNPGTALYYYFIDPLRETWSLHELAIKAAPLILIAGGLSICYLSNNWNIGAEGQFILGAIVGSILPVMFPQFQTRSSCP